MNDQPVEFPWRQSVRDLTQKGQVDEAVALLRDRIETCTGIESAEAAITLASWSLYHPTEARGLPRLPLALVVPVSMGTPTVPELIGLLEHAVRAGEGTVTSGRAALMLADVSRRLAGTAALPDGPPHHRPSGLSPDDIDADTVTWAVLGRFVDAGRERAINAYAIAARLGDEATRDQAWRGLIVFVDALDAAEDIPHAVAGCDALLLAPDTVFDAGERQTIQRQRTQLIDLPLAKARAAVILTRHGEHEIAAMLDGEIVSKLRYFGVYTLTQEAADRVLDILQPHRRRPLVAAAISLVEQRVKTLGEADRRSRHVS